MNIDMLRVFCDVVRCQSFSRGAAANNISQSAASQTIHQLERHFGVQLIDRSKRPFLLTPEGDACYQGFHEILGRFDSLDAHVRSMRKEISGTVRVAAIYSVGLHDMSRCMQRFMSQYPDASVRLEFLHPRRVAEAVLDEEVDLGVISYPVETRGLSIIPLRSENMVLVCHPDHRLATMERVTIGQLRGEDYVAFDPDLMIRKELDRYLRQNEVVVHIVMEFDNIETIKQAIEIGAGVSILPEPTVRKEVLAGTLAVVPLAIHELRRPIGILHRQRKMFTPTILKFIELLQEEANGDGDVE
jgi:DNA-binding transcriptional LysR family regulator